MGLAEIAWLHRGLQAMLPESSFPEFLEVVPGLPGPIWRDSFLSQPFLLWNYRKEFDASTIASMC